jgi:methylthioribose-1-phosphate isomerase
MKVDGIWRQAIWTGGENLRQVFIFDQTKLPHKLVEKELINTDSAIDAICNMEVRGAPLIGVTGAYAVCLAVAATPKNQDPDAWLVNECARIAAARPTAVNLAWAVDKMKNALLGQKDFSNRLSLAYENAKIILEGEVDCCKHIGIHGLELLKDLSSKKGGRPLNILTHCNAGWLACVDYGTATAPIYAAFDEGIPVHVWVDETRPLNQGARLTAWEMLHHGVPHTLITDNAGGHLMQHGLVDAVIVGTDRTTHTGDVCNKIGTYLKALAAFDNNVPFFVALPSSTIDWEIENGLNIPIEQRNPHEITLVQGLCDGQLKSVLVPPEQSPARNDAFDVTPARLVTGLITERGVCRADKKSIAALFPDKSRK